MYGIELWVNNGQISRFPKDLELYVTPADYHKTFHFEKYIRNNLCHIENVNVIKRDQICYEKIRPVIALWGESNGASLYPGLKKLQNEYGFGIIQVTQSSCPPIFNLPLSILRDRKNCNELNLDVFNELIKIKPEQILLYAAWRHWNYPLEDDILIGELEKTIKVIKKRIPNARILLVGPPPMWGLNQVNWDSPQKAGYKFWKKSINKTANIPLYLEAILHNNLEIEMQKLSNRNNIQYISLIKNLCKDNYCLTRVGNDVTDFIAVDYAHFSKSGSEFIIDKIGDKVIEGFGLRKNIAN